MKNKALKITLSIIFILLSYGFIAYKIYNFKELKQLSLFDNSYSLFDLLIFFIVLLLMFLNWGLETAKWKISIAKITHISFCSAFKAIFFGITIGIFTPNRVGEIGGRVLFLEKGQRTYGILGSGIGSLAQFITTLLTGIFGLVLMILVYPDKIKLNYLFNSFSVFFLLTIVIILLWAFFNIKRISPILCRFAFLKTRITQLEHLSQTKLKSLFKILILSITRYLVFVIQFFLLLKLFNVSLTVIQAYIAISLIYLCATIIPTTTLAELGIRGSLAIFFIGLFSNNILGIVFSTIILWIINLALPAIIGSIFFVKNKL